MRYPLTHPATASMVRDEKVQAKVGDKVRSADFRSEFSGRVGTIIDITDAGHGKCLTVRFPARHWAGVTKRAGKESTGAKWYTWVSAGEQS